MRQMSFTGRPAHRLHWFGFGSPDFAAYPENPEMRW
jgi:hypothetical protein